MKVAITLLALVGFAVAAVPSVPRAPTTLPEAVQIFSDLLQMNQVREIIEHWTATNNEVAEIINYLNSPRFINNYQTVAETPEFAEFAEWVRSTGVSLGGDVSTVITPQSKGQVVTFSWSEMAEEIMALWVDTEVLKSKATELHAEDGEVAEFIKKFIALRPLINEVSATYEFQAMWQDLRDLGVSTDLYLESFTRIFDFLESL